MGLLITKVMHATRTKHRKSSRLMTSTHDHKVEMIMLCVSLFPYSLYVC